MKGQLDLFNDWHPTETKVAGIVRAFPPARRTALVGSTAMTIFRKPYEGGRAFWARHTAQLRREMRAHGIGADAIEREIQRYAAAVGRELDRLSWICRRPDGAA